MPAALSRELETIEKNAKPLKLGNFILYNSQQGHKKSAYILESKCDYSEILETQKDYMKNK